MTGRALSPLQCPRTEQDKDQGRAVDHPTSRTDWRDLVQVCRTLPGTTAMTWRYLGINLSIALAYTGLAWSASHAFSLFVPIWPSTALAVVAVLRGGWRWVPGIVLGSWAANDLLLGWSTPGALWVTLGNTLSPLLAWGAFHRIEPDPDKVFERIPNVIAFFLLFGVLNGMLSGFFGATGVCDFEGLSADRFYPTWVSWGVGDAASSLLLAPALLLWLQAPPWRHPPKSTVKLVITAALLFASTAWLYLLPVAPPWQFIVMGALPVILLPLAWAALRLHPRDAYTLLALTFVIMVAGTLLDTAPMAALDQGQAITILQLHISLLGALVLVITTLDQERRHANESLRQLTQELERQVRDRTRKLTENHARLERIIEALPAPMVMSRASDGYVEQVNMAAAKLFDATPDRLIGTSTIDFYCDPKDRTRLIDHLRNDGVACQYEVCMKTAEGRKRWVLLTAALMPDDGDYVLAVLQDISERKREKDALEHMASIDDLTGMLTRRALFERAQRKLAEAPTHSALLILDLDHFKQVNDRFGHLSGDEVLRQVSRRIHEGLRSDDLLGRLGGEEFAVLMHCHQAGDALELAERLRQAVEQLRVPLDGGEIYRPTVSIGVALPDGHPTTLTQLLSRADQALYRAKAEGRNRVACQEAASCDTVRAKD